MANNVTHGSLQLASWRFRMHIFISIFVKVKFKDIYIEQTSKLVKHNKIKLPNSAE